MPCYLFTYHTYGSWLPDRPQGYVRRGEGVLPTDHDMADAYRQQMKQDAVLFDEQQQRVAIDAVLTTAEHIVASVHAIATELTHLHLLTSWRDERPHDKVSTSFKRGVTITLRRNCDEKKWLSRDHSRKRVEDREHFEYLIEEYLPNHSGWKWSESRGYFRSADV
ncbi:MAG: hypothetical protein AAGB00_10520 [Planctomycetota bacterium]